MGPQHHRDASPNVKTCLAKKCGDLIKGEESNFERRVRVCRLTGKIPGHMTECPKDHGSRCPQLQACPLLWVGMACSTCMKTPMNSQGRV